MQAVLLVNAYNPNYLLLVLGSKSQNSDPSLRRVMIAEKQAVSGWRQNGPLGTEQ
jgi:hypothetical protein